MDSALTTVFPAVAAGLAEKGVTLKCDEPSKAALASHSISSVEDAVPEDGIVDVHSRSIKFDDRLTAMFDAPREHDTGLKLVSLALNSKHTSD